MAKGYGGIRTKTKMLEEKLAATSRRLIQRQRRRHQRRKKKWRKLKNDNGVAGISKAK